MIKKLVNFNTVHNFVDNEENNFSINSNFEMIHKKINELIETINEMKINEVRKVKVLELFGGIGACSKALERLGIDYEIADYVEIDKYAVKSFNAIHGTNFEPQDICQWDKDIEVDLIMHGSPCQDFSVAGKQAGGDEGSGTRSSLMYETLRIVEKLKPNYVIWENVKNVISKTHVHNFNNYIDRMNELGYKSYFQVLNAKNYGIPQNRERVFTISIRKDIDTGFVFPQKQELKLKLKDLLEDEVDEKYYLSEQQVERIKTTNYNVGKQRIQEKDYCDTLCARDWKDPKCIQVGNLVGGKWDKTIESCRRVYDEEGLSPTINTYQGGNTEAKILIRNNTNKGYLEAENGDGIYTNLTNKRGTVQKQMIPALTSLQDKGVVVINKNNHECQSEQVQPKVLGGIGEKDSNGGTQWKQQNRIYDDNMAISVTTAFRPYYKDSLTIRKLTPKECWRLMGFDDEDFDKASKENSNTQLYKQAGNSIVVNVLEEIFKNLLMK